MNLNEECLLKYLQNPDELVDLTSLLLEFNNDYEKIKDKIAQYLKDKTFLRYLLYSIYIVITTCVLFVFLTHPAIRGFLRL